MSAKKSNGKSVAKKTTPTKVGVTRKPNALHETLVKLMSRPNGATMHDTYNAGFEYPAMAAVKIVERRGYKVSKKKEAGALTRYIAKRA
jgi:hypothetical protein